MADAWMLRNDGKLFEVPFHPFGSTDSDDYELELANLTFLYNTTADPSIRKKYEDLAREWLLDHGLDTSMDVQTYPFDTEDPYIKKLRVFLIKHAEEILAVDSDGPDVRQLLWNLTWDLNQLFCRVRYGGKTNTTEGCTDLYFRVSSVGFDWFPVIKKGVKNILTIKPDTQTITICRDKETSGTDAPVMDNRANVYDKMPLQAFLDLLQDSRLTLLPEELRTSGHKGIYDLLGEGKPVSYIKKEAASEFEDIIESLRNKEVELSTVRSALMPA